MLAWNTTAIDDESQEQQANDGNDLNRCEDKLGLTIDGDCENVQAQHQDDDEGDPSCHVDVPSSFPILDYSRGGGDLRAKSDRRRVPVVPANSETHGIVNVTSAKLRDSSRKRQPGCHLTERHHHSKDSQASESVAEQDGERTSMGECTANTQEQTSAYCSSKRNELNMSRFESSRDIAVLLGGLDVAEDIGGLVDFGSASGLVGDLAILTSQARS